MADDGAAADAEAGASDDSCRDMFEQFMDENPFDEFTGYEDAGDDDQNLQLCIN